MIIKYTVRAVPEDTPVVGNALASGDDEVDKACEREILARINRGDVWAWAHVTVTAEAEGFNGSASLGCCSYEDEDAFKRDGYYADMCNAAREDLIANIEETRARLVRLDASLPRCARCTAGGMAPTHECACVERVKAACEHCARCSGHYGAR